VAIRKPTNNPKCLAIRSRAESGQPNYHRSLAVEGRSQAVEAIQARLSINLVPVDGILRTKRPACGRVSSFFSVFPSVAAVFLPGFVNRKRSPSTKITRQVKKISRFLLASVLTRC
jgi:hypothetical protein